MGLFELFVGVLLCLVLAIIVATLFIALSGNTEVGGRIRQHLMERVMLRRNSGQAWRMKARSSDHAFFLAAEHYLRSDARIVTTFPTKL